MSKFPSHKQGLITWFLKDGCNEKLNLDPKEWAWKRI